MLVGFYSNGDVRARWSFYEISGRRMCGIKAESRAFFAKLGKHISQLRKARGFTQAELARGIGVSQQAVFAYELGDRRVSVFVLGKMAKLFKIPIAAFLELGEPVSLPKRRISPRAMRHAERIMALSITQQRFVVRIIDTLVETNEVKTLESNAK